MLGGKGSNNWDNQILAAKAGITAVSHDISPAEAAVEMRCKETKSGGGGCRVGKTQKLEPGGPGSSLGSATDNLRCLGQVKLHIWAWLPHL